MHGTEAPLCKGGCQLSGPRRSPASAGSPGRGGAE
nr:MAG TPA: hypothetical protein [Caudoviricetes sp.]